MSAGNTPEGRRRLLANGFEAIILNGKAPVSKNWQTGEVTAERLASWENENPRGGNTGLRTGRLAVFDIDLENPAHAEAVADAIEGVLGVTDAKRYGRKGVALCYFNAAAPLRKISISGRLPGGTKPRLLVEVLGLGQQVATYGPHPDTGKPYRWPIGNPLEGRLEDLEEVNRRDIRRAASVARDALEEIGAEGLEVTGDLDDSPREVRPVQHGQPVTVEAFKAMFATVDPSCDRLTWIGWLGVIKDAPLVEEDGSEVENFDGAGFAISWSSGEHGGFEPGNYLGSEDVARAFDSLSRSSGGRGLGSLIEEARRNGYTGLTRAYTVEELEAVRVPKVSAIERFYRGQGLRVVVDNAAPAPDEIPEDERRDPARRRSFKPRSEAEQDRQPDIEWLISGVLQRETLALFYGPENSFKSFLVLDMALCAAAGLPWGSYGAQNDTGGYAPARHLTTVYLAGEGSHGIERKRRPAWREAREITSRLPFYTVDEMPFFSQVEEVEGLIADIREAGIEPDIIVVDTAARAMVGLDENSAKDTGLFVAACDRLKREFRCCVVVVHHTGKKESHGARGSTNLPASFDARFKVTADIGSLVATIKNEKQKDGDPWERPITFKGEKSHGSLVFRRQAPTGQNLPTADDKRQAEVREALAAAGGLAGIVSTPVLAAELARRKLDEDPAARDKANLIDLDRLAKNESRNLQRQTKDRADRSPGLLRQFVVGSPTGGELSWTIPPEEEE